MNEESIGDYESTVKKFRELVRSLHRYGLTPYVA